VRAEGALAKRGKDRFMLLRFCSARRYRRAGDSFNAGFLHKFIRGAGLQDCLEYGNMSAALSTTRAGARKHFATASTVRHL